MTNTYYIKAHCGETLWVAELAFRCTLDIDLNDSTIKRLVANYLLE